MRQWPTYLSHHYAYRALTACEARQRTISYLGLRGTSLSLSLALNGGPRDVTSLSLSLSLEYYVSFQSESVVLAP